MPEDSYHVGYYRHGDCVKVADILTDRRSGLFRPEDKSTIPSKRQ
jgi:hypothetical protein